MAIHWSGVEPSAAAAARADVSAAELGGPCRVSSVAAGELRLEFWRWNQRFELPLSVAPGADPDEVAALVVDALEGWVKQVRQAAPLMRDVVDVGEMVERERVFGRGGELLSEQQRFVFGMGRAEAHARLCLGNRPGIIFNDCDSGEYAIALRQPPAAAEGQVAAGQVAVVTEPELRLDSFAGPVHAVTLARIDALGATVGGEKVEVPVLPPVSGLAGHVDAMFALPVTFAMGRDLERGPFVVHRDGEQLRVYDYVSETSDVELGCMDGFVPAELRAADEPTTSWRDILMCPSCRADLPWRDDDLRCSGCGTVYPVRDGRPHFLSGELAPPTPHGEDSWAPTPTPKALLYFVMKYPGGVVLDCGAGNGTFQRGNLINLEIFPFGNTTVVTDGATLPFRSGSIDAVMSVAVIEHVPNPFEYCDELARVLRPGGEMRMDAPFMVPYHACPDHYFNPTASGAKAALRGIEVERMVIGPHQSPFVALQALVHEYHRLLPDIAARAAFKKLTMAEVLRAGVGAAPPGTRIAPADGAGIAAGFAIHGSRARKEGDS